MRRVVIDVEANGLENPTEIWLIICKDVDTGELRVFRNVTQDKDTKEDFLAYAAGVTCWIGHNWLGYDHPVLNRLVGLNVLDLVSCSCDTLILSKLVNYSRSGHSVEDYGLEFGIPKGTFSDFTKYSKEMEEYCERDVEITHRIYLLYRDTFDSDSWKPAIHLEQRFQLIVNDLHNNGFAFNKTKAQSLLDRVTKDLSELDGQILEAFPPREVLIREFIPKATKHGTISKTSVPRALHDHMHDYVIGVTYRHTRTEPFNPSSHKQIIQVLSEAGWAPTEKTKSHIDLERQVNRAKYQDRLDTIDESTYSKLDNLKKTGYKVTENNLATLPPDAPAPARLLAKRILLEARRRTLTEWIELVHTDGRIRGKFYGIGAWTHRMAHQNPNCANIPREFKEDGSVKLLGKELRSLWIAPKGRLLVGVDAEGIQLRILAHYLDDPEFTRALVEGKKHDKSDPHSLNQRILGHVCKSRQAAKRFVYALLLGAGISKLADVLETSRDEAQSALERLMARYQGWTYLKKSIIPIDGERGWFQGIDGRRVQIPGTTSRDREHLAMSGYLQSGEAIVMKKAATIFDDYRKTDKDFKDVMMVNLVHDENQDEVPNNMRIAEKVGRYRSNSIREAGEFYKLKCPMAGSYYNEDTKDYTIGTNWYATH